MLTIPLAIRAAGKRARPGAGIPAAHPIRRPFRALLAILAACCLLWAQQAATAHSIGHIGSTIAGASAAAGDNGEAPGSACPSCARFAGLIAAPPAFLPPLVLPHTAATAPADVASGYLPAHPPPPYTARAPPALL